MNSQTHAKLFVHSYYPFPPPPSSPFHRTRIAAFWTMHHLYRHWAYRGKLGEQEKKDVANYKNGFIYILGDALDDHDLMVALSVFDMIHPR